jgi:dihydrofolate reductase
MSDWMYEEPNASEATGLIPRFEVPERTTAIIVAAAANGVIGKDGGLPWHLPDDMKYFKRMTMGHPMVMGRKTLETMDRPLPGRPHIIMTRRVDYELPPGFHGVSEPVQVHHDIATAIDAARRLATDGIVFVIGGAEIYRQALPLVDRVYLTRVHAHPDGDVRFDFLPDAREDWQRVEQFDHPPDEKHKLGFTFEAYQRVSNR